jgi:TIR domain/NACHT domain
VCTLTASAVNPDVFVSHARLDLDAVREIVTRIRKHGYTVWVDYERIKPGESFLANIYAGLEASTCILLAISRNFLSSDWCQDELTAAITDQVSRGKKILPVLLDDTEPDGLPAILRARKAIWPSELAASLKETIGLPRFWTFEAESVSAQSPAVFQKPDLQPLKPREIRFRPAMPLGLFLDQPGERSLEALVRSLSAVRQDTGNYLILGEAGIGKTTCASHINTVFRQRLMQATKPHVVPRFIRLGEKASDDGASALRSVIDEETIHAAEETGYPILLIMDGLNELSPELLDLVLRTAATTADHPFVRLLVTSRPTPLLARLLEIESVHFQALRIERWSAQKVKSYFGHRGFSRLYGQLNPEVADALRLPLLASLLIRRIDESRRRPSLRTVADVFEYIVSDATKRIDSVSTAINPSSMSTVDARRTLEVLALSMTNRRTVVVSGTQLLQDLSLGDDPPRLVEAMVHSGILRTVDPIAHINAPFNLEALQSINFSFVHQAVQEFLTASAIRTKSPLSQEWMNHLPDDVSQDSYFREIPLYLIDLLNSPDEKLHFADHFRVSGDLLTAARLVDSIGDPALSHELRANIATGVRASIGLPSFYPRTSDTLRALGPKAIRDLVEFVSRPGVAEEIYSEPEARIFGLPFDGADEVTWRIIGRSIVFLSEMGNSEWLETVGKRVRDFTSTHLAYHVGECLTILAESGLRSETVREVTSELRACRVADSISGAYAAGVILTLGDDIATGDVSRALQERLVELSASRRPHYTDEFWQRAHGVDALGLVGSAADCVATIGTVVEHELASIGEGMTQVGFHTPVLSSAVRSVARCCGRFRGMTPDWRDLLEQFFISSVPSQNRWLLGHIRLLLITHFQSDDDLSWLETWRSSSRISHPVKKAIGDALWYGGR